MKVLMISTDEGLLDNRSDVSLRHIEYGKNYEESHIIVFSKKDVEEFKLSENIWIYSTRSFAQGFYMSDAVRKAGLVIKNHSFKQEDLITVQDPFFTALVGVKLKKLFSLVLEIQVHTDIGSPYYVSENLMNRLRFNISKKTLRKANRVRVVSNKIKNFLINDERFLIDADKIEVRSIKVSVERIKNAEISVNIKQKYPQFDKIILMASRLTKEKDICTALKAFKVVRESLPKAGLVIVGSGPELARLKRRAERTGLTGSVIFENWLSQNELFSYYKTADVFLSTSLYEGYGMSMVEANTAGLPVVATEAGVAPELTSNICPVGDYKCLAGFVIKILNININYIAK